MNTAADNRLPCPNAGEPLLVSVEQAAQRLGIGRTKLYEYLMSGDLQSLTLGSRRLISLSSLEDFVNRRVQEEGLL
jgi:excisionase family DNA binding protein